MNRSSNPTTRSPHSAREKVVLTAVLAVLGLSHPAGANPIRNHSTHIHAEQVLTSSEVNSLRAWTNFIAGGQTVWESTPPPTITQPVRAAFAQNLAAPNPTQNPWVEYLQFRRDLDPTRFDHWHPQLGPRLENLTPPTTPPSTTPPATTPPGGEEITPPSLPPSVPEPGTFAMALALLAGGAWWRRSARPRS